MGINRGQTETEFPELSVDVGDAGLIYVDSSNRVGIGVSDPAAELEVMATSTQMMLSYDSDSFTTVTVADASHTTIATGESGNLIFDAAGDIELNADGADIVFKDGSATIGKFSSTSVLGMTLGAGVAEDIMIAFDGNAQDFRIGIDDGTDTLEIGHGTAHGTNTAITIDSSGQVTKFNIPAAAVAQASDHIIFLDGGATGAPKAESIDDFLTAIAGSGISVSSSQLTASGGASALNDLSDASFSSGDLTITALDKLTTSASAHNAAGTSVLIAAGDTTAGTTNNIAGGTLTIAAGRGKGSGAGGDIIFQTANAGSSGSSLNDLSTALTISDDLSSTFAGGIISTAASNTLGATSFNDANITNVGDIALDSISSDGSLVTINAPLEIAQGSSGGAAALLLDNDDTDQIALNIEAANIDADVINITADAVTTAHVIDVSADALTTGSILNLASDSSSTGTRALVNITNDNTSATGTSLMLLKNDAAGAGGILVETTAAETKPLLELINSSNNADKPPILAFNKVGGAQDDYHIGRIDFKGDDNAGTPNTKTYASILGLASDVESSGNAQSGEMRFLTMVNNTEVECMRIGKEDTAGGTPAFALAINQNGDDLDFIVSTDNTGNMLRTNAGDDLIGIGGFPAANTATIYLGASFAKHQHTQTGSTLTASATHNVIICNTTSNSIVVTLPALSTSLGREYTFMKVHASNNMDIVPASGEKIYTTGSGVGSSSQVRRDAFGSVLRIMGTGFGWMVIADYVPT